MSQPHCGACGTCTRCRIAAKDGRYAALWQLPFGGVVPPAPPPPAKAAPCRFEGDDLTGPEREAAGLPHARRWLHCLHDDQPLGPHVCGCKGCGPKCPGYSPSPPGEQP